MSAPALDAARAALAGGELAWVVGGAVRDALLGRATADVDLVVAGDARSAARTLARDAGGPAFELSGEFGAWRVIGPERRWQVDIAPLQGGSLDEDLARRDFTINAMAEPLAGGDVVDPHGGARDLAARRLRMVSPASFDDDPLRTLRLARFASELDLEPDPDTVAAAAQRAPRIAEVAAERVFAELKRVVAADRVLDGLALMDRLRLTEHVLPEITALRGVEQNRYHHLDVHDHTLEVLAETVALERDPGAVLGEELAGPIRAYLAQPLSDELTRGVALRFGALLHDVAKPETQTRHEDGSILGFPGHADLGAERARAALTRLRTSERLRAHVALLARHHLGLGYLVHQAPLDRRAIHQYLVKTSPVEVDVSLLSIADRLATRGRKADEAIAKHLEIARVVLPEALAYADFAAQPPLVRGDELARALGIRPGPALGTLLAQLEEARFAGEITTPDEAIELARRLVG
ncbi:MAG TPA: HDIG domain-containing protein [Baekduia sp.]|uniref:HDIG domain-containing metalloprotein n=1 Tax=Baekduia sp. TaxID=2600305 RepID=UPI002C3B5883|nr:HDIG domain-containing metalloprotein [Baekduia sp.]HMJ33252.1 HDIG domain-containing protein [Baekduia sp.]